jgi:hypothetical protein
VKALSIVTHRLEIGFPCGDFSRLWLGVSKKLGFPSIYTGENAT